MLKIKEILHSRNFKVLILVGIAMLVVFSTFPYFNLIFGQQIMLLFLLTFLVSILNFSVRYLFAISLVFVIFSLILLLLSLNSIAEKLGNYAFILILLGFMQNIFKYLFVNNENN